MKFAHFKAFIFDLDGTILDSNPLNMESFLYTCRKHLDREIDIEEFKRLFGRPLLEQMRYFSEEKAEEMVKTYRSYMDEIHDKKIKLFPEAKEVLKGLREKNITCALVTSKSKPFAQRALDLFNIDSYFHVKVFYEDCTQHKPHPEPYNIAVNKLNLPPGEILSIGDSPYDIIASKKAGLKTAVVSWTDFPPEKIEDAKPDFILNSLKEIL